MIFLNFVVCYVLFAGIFHIICIVFNLFDYMITSLEMLLAEASKPHNSLNVPENTLDSLSHLIAHLKDRDDSVSEGFFLFLPNILALLMCFLYRELFTNNSE